MSHNPGGLIEAEIFCETLVITGTMCLTNERRCYNVTSSLIDWAHTQNGPELTAVLLTMFDNGLVLMAKNYLCQLKDMIENTIFWCFSSNNSTRKDLKLSMGIVAYNCTHWSTVSWTHQGLTIMVVMLKIIFSNLFSLKDNLAFKFMISSKFVPGVPIENNLVLFM